MDIYNLISTMIGLGGLIIAVLTYLDKKKSERKKIVNLLNNYSDIVRFNSNIMILPTRESMVEYLKSQYDRAEEGDTIWGQSVSGKAYSNVEGKLLDAASRNVNFQMIFNKNTVRINPIIKLFTNLKNAEVILREDNNLRLQGLSFKELVIALPDKEKYIAIVIKDMVFVQIIYENWFKNRFENE